MCEVNCVKKERREPFVRLWNEKGYFFVLKYNKNLLNVHSHWVS
jgi:hypothetical protein